MGAKGSQVVGNYTLIKTQIISTLEEILRLIKVETSKTQTNNSCK